MTRMVLITYSTALTQVRRSRLTVNQLEMSVNLISHLWIMTSFPNSLSELREAMYLI